VVYAILLEAIPRLATPNVFQPNVGAAKVYAVCITSVVYVSTLVARALAEAHPAVAHEVRVARFVREIQVGDAFGGHFRLREVGAFIHRLVAFQGIDVTPIVWAPVVYPTVQFRVSRVVNTILLLAIPSVA
jgi:hypothetical protein